MTTEINESGKQEDENEVVIDLFAKGADDIITGEQEAVEAAATQEPTDDEGKAAGVEQAPIPDKFKGKSAEEIAQSYTELEREFGRRGNELGELRDITNRILESQLTTTTGDGDDKGTGKVTSDALLENPDKVIADAVANSPSMRQLEKSRAEENLERAFDQFKVDHPDAEKVVGDPRFQTWIQKNPVRAKRWTEADSKYDFATAGDIISTYKEIADVTNADTVATRQAALASVASPDASAGNADTSGKKKIYLKSELMKLKYSDADRYERLQPQIIAAYAEGRVR